jgi:hypothetical protein
MRRLVAAILSAWVGLVIAGCAVDRPVGGSAAGEPVVGPLLEVTDLRTFTLPLDSFRMTAAGLRDTDRAQRALIQRCLRRFGFGYQLPAPSGQSVVVGDERRYGMADEEAAKARGYHVPDKQDNQSYQDPPPDVSAVIQGSGQRSHHGVPVPAGGCTGEARRRLAEGTAEGQDEHLPDKLSLANFARTRADSRVRDANGKWSACMRQAGYDYPDPMKAIGDPAFQTPAASQREIGVAVADVRCKKATNFINVIASVETAYQQRAVQANADALAVIKRNLAIRERNAAAILAAQP